MKTFKELLNELEDKGLDTYKIKAYENFKRWAADKTWQEVYETCERGDWLLWLFEKTTPKEERLLVLVCGHCANIIRRLMKDERSLAAVDAAIAYGEGKINKEELTYVGYAAFSAANAARDSKVHGRDLDWTIARVAAYVVQVPDNDSCFYTLDVAADAAALYASDAGAAAEYNERAAYRRKSADIIRKYIPIGKFNILNVADSAATEPKEEPAIEDKTPVKFKNKPLFFLYTSNPHYQRILKMHGEKYTIEPILLERPDGRVTMENLESNQIVCTGDGEHFYFLLTER